MAAGETERQGYAGIGRLPGCGIIGAVIRFNAAGLAMAESVNTHERLSGGGDLARTSNRVFGFTFAAVFTVIGLLPLLLFRETPRWWALGIAGAFLTAALAWPPLLTPLNWVWHRVRLVLNRIIAFVVMALLFYGVVLPTGLIRRLLGKDPLRLRYDRAAASYWQRREPPGPDPETMKNQF